MSVQIKENDTRSIANDYYDSDSKSISPLKPKRKFKMVNFRPTSGKETDVITVSVATKESKKYQLKSEVLNTKIIDAILGKIPHFNHAMGERSIVEICHTEAPKRLNVLPPVLVPVKLHPTQITKLKNEKELEHETLHVAKILKKGEREQYPKYGRDYKLESMLKKLHSTFPIIETAQSKRPKSSAKSPVALPQRINHRYLINNRLAYTQSARRTHKEVADIDDLGHGPADFKSLDAFQCFELKGKPCVNRTPEINVHPEASRPNTAISIRRKSRKSIIPATPKSRQNPHKPALIGIKQRAMFETTSCQAITRMMKSSFKAEFYQMNYDYYTAKRIQVTKNKIDGKF
ncbi:hypothetical protein HDV06_006109 [Boothiomyces sp. JEL0866]|nr:hypothetical protein HDV06_006109 [Boothiomyces sp. JEL0866]